MGHGLELTGCRHPHLEFPHDAFPDFHHPAALRTHQMMLVTVASFRQQGEPRRPVSKIKPFDQPQPLQHLHGTINGRQIAMALRQGLKDFLVGQRTGLIA